MGLVKYLQNIIEQFFGFKFENVSSFSKFVEFMYQPKHPSSLAITRICFGMLMLVDVLYERGGLRIISRWGDPRDCHFALFPQIHPLPLHYMTVIYGIMWIGALGITIGYKFRYTTAMHFIPYWYILLLDKSYWNNHSYLFGLVSILLLGSSANSAYSLDAFLEKSKSSNTPNTVPLWNYFILKFQFFNLYFMAGLKKIDMEWLGGHSMDNWGTHWIFDPFRLILTTEQIDYLVIHWFGFLLDLTVGFWLLNGTTRPFAMLFCGTFHLMNSQMFSIGMFPYVCLLTMPIFCNDDWPVRFWNNLMVGSMNGKRREKDVAICQQKVTTDNIKQSKAPISNQQKFMGALLIFHCVLQGFLPYSHFITKGYNNWTNGLYGYSWDMMVHSWNSALVVVKVTDNENGKEYFISPDAWTKNERWSKHADMCVQYAQCLKTNLLDLSAEGKSGRKGSRKESIIEISNNISVYIDVWCSLNGRFQQRMFDPNYDLLKANWSPLKPVEWLLPLLTESDKFRNRLKAVRDDVYAWSNYSDVLFIADFPNMHLENYLSTDLRNVTLTILDGEVIYEIENANSKQSRGSKLSKGASYEIATGMFHKIHTIGSRPSLYMYTYINQTKEMLDGQTLNEKCIGRYISH